MPLERLLGSDGQLSCKRRPLVKGNSSTKAGLPSDSGRSAIGDDMISEIPVTETIFPLPCTVFPLSLSVPYDADLLWIFDISAIELV